MLSNNASINGDFVTIPDEKFTTILDQLPGCWGIKDRQSRFIYANKEYAHLLGFESTNCFKIIGLTDFDMPCKTSKCAHLFRAQDASVRETQKTIRVLNVHPFADGKWKAYLFTKLPFYNEQREVIGTLFHGIDICSFNASTLGTILSQDVTKPQIDEKRPVLSKREHECLIFLLLGKTAKQIAQTLSISYRTVEEYILQIKLKFKVDSKGDLIGKALQLGFLSDIPSSLFATLQVQCSIVL